jgi:haloalkane dehalogenase
MQCKRTPDECFEGLEDYDFKPNYLEIPDGEDGSLRVHYLDEGPRDGPLVLLMHGQPAWSYLYRFMIPPLVDAGFRVVAPDLVGFGRSDKPTQVDDYTYARHVAWMSHWLTALDLRDITAFVQDWGSLIGLRLVAAFPDRFARVVLANGGLPTGLIPEKLTSKIREAAALLPLVSHEELGERFRDKSGLPGLLYWQKYCLESPDIIRLGDTLMGGARGLSREAKAAFNAPFPDESYLAGVRKFPSLIPLFHDDAEVQENKAAWQVLKQFDKPFLCAFSDADPITAGADASFLKVVPGCSGLPHRTIAPAGHFLQQEQPEQCVQAILDVCKYGG